MAVSRDGTLSSTDFYVAATAFAELWRKFNHTLSPWTWISSPRRPWISHNQEEGYLSVESVIIPRLSEEELREDHRIEKEECSSAEGDESIDTATLVPYNGGEHRYDLHVVYSSSYRVPVLYFRAYSSDGQPLVLEDIEKDLPINYAGPTRSKWTFITQEEHPVLNRPWYTLHPCGTSEWMKLLLCNEASVAQNAELLVEKYLVSWFSVVGQVFGLKIPMEMLHDSLLLHDDRVRQ